MVFARSCRQRTISFFTLDGWWELKFRYCPMKVVFRYTDNLNPCSVRVISKSWKDYLLSCSFSIMNCIDGRIVFIWSSSIWISFWWNQKMNVSSSYLSHNDGFSPRCCVGSRVRHETLEEGRRRYRPKRCEYNNEDEVNSPNILGDKNYQALSQKFWQIIFIHYTEILPKQGQLTTRDKFVIERKKFVARQWIIISLREWAYSFLPLLHTACS